MRHGEVLSEYVGTFLGSTDIGLSDVGKHQAEAIGAFLGEAGIDAVLSSPKQRATATAVPLAKAAEVEVGIRADLAEMDFGKWETKTWEMIAADDPAYAEEWQQDPTTMPCPGGETAGGFAERVQAELLTILDEFKGRNIAIFSHAGTNRAFLAKVLGMSYMQTFAFSQDYGCVNAAGWMDELAQVALVNFVPGPRSALHGDGGRKVET